MNHQKNIFKKKTTRVTLTDILHLPIHHIQAAPRPAQRQRRRRRHIITKSCAKFSVKIKSLHKYWRIFWNDDYSRISDPPTSCPHSTRSYRKWQRNRRHGSPQNHQLWSSWMRSATTTIRTIKMMISIRTRCKVLSPSTLTRTMMIIWATNMEAGGHTQ